jgi:glycosyltransferase involved in cell wall biosynthesis
MVCGLRNYAAYEHGTIREIPFELTTRGRVCALSYRDAPIVFVTNTDNLAATERLGIEEKRIVCLPHAFDSDKLERFADDNPGLQPPSDGPVVFFSPTRQHWINENPSLAKGNDRAIRALKSVADRGLDCRLELVEWGQDVEASKRLVRELGLEERVQWLPTMKKRELWACYLTTHAVLDQFLLPAIGGVTFEAMALGRRVITALDIAANERFFGAAPPLFACRTSEEIATAMMQIKRDPEDSERRGAAARAWIRRYHSADRIVALQLAAYRQLLAPERSHQETLHARHEAPLERGVGAC